MFQRLESGYLWGMGLFQPMTLLNTHFYFLCCWKSPGFFQDDIVLIKCRQWLMMNLNQLCPSVSICHAAMDGPGIQAWQMRHKKKLICNVSLQKGAFVKTENGISSTDTISGPILHLEIRYDFLLLRQRLWSWSRKADKGRRVAKLKMGKLMDVHY